MYYIYICIKKNLFFILYFSLKNKRLEFKERFYKSKITMIYFFWRQIKLSGNRSMLSDREIND